MRIDVLVNGNRQTSDVEPRMLLSDYVRHELHLHGTHVGCEHGVCGACTVQLDGQPIRACLLFAVQANHRSITTIEGIAGDDPLHPIQEAFVNAHALQCGFCTPGFIVTLDAFLRGNHEPTAHDVEEALSGNLCRCTGYLAIRKAVLQAAETLRNCGRPASSDQSEKADE